MKFQLKVSILVLSIFWSCSIDKGLETPKSDVEERIEAEINGKKVVIDICNAVENSRYIQPLSLSDYHYPSINFFFPPSIQVYKYYSFSEEDLFAENGNTVEDVLYNSN